MALVRKSPKPAPLVAFAVPVAEDAVLSPIFDKA
jgi:hypothetical protein